jgi:hypothetical protein
VTAKVGDAFELVCVALRVGDCADDVKQAIADKIVLLSKSGVCCPDVLCEQVLNDIRAQPDVQAPPKVVTVHGPTPVASS